MKKVRYNPGDLIVVVEKNKSDAFYEINVEKVEEIVISKDGIRYWIKNFGDSISDECIYPSIDKALEFLKSELTKKWS